MSSNPLRYGIIGTGMMGVEHIRDIQAVEDAEVVALCDPDEGSLSCARQIVEQGAAGDSAAGNSSAGDSAAGTAEASPACFSDHRDLLAAGSCDAVVVATPNMTHVNILLDVIAAGVPVLVEKPLCTTVAQCQQVVDAVRHASAGHPGGGAQTEHPGGGAQGDPLVWVGLEYRYMPAIAQLIEQVAAGVTGPVRMVSIREHRFPFLKKVNDWNRFNANTGGTLVEKCCHFFDLMSIITQAQPIAVMASGGQDVNHLDERYDGRTPDILDNAYVVVEFDSGARAMLDLCMFAEATRNQEEISVVGSLGKLEALVPDSVVRTGIRGTHSIGNVDEQAAENPEIRYLGHHHGASYIEHLRFGAAVRSRGNGMAGSQAGGNQTAGSQAASNQTGGNQTTGNESGPEAGLMSVAVGVAAQISIAERRRVDMAEVIS